MTPPLNAAQRDAFQAALVSEIKAEMGRRDLSSRGLGRLIDQSSQYMSMRIDGGNPKTGRMVDLTVADVTAIASAFEMDPSELFDRAERAVSGLSDKTDLTQGDVALAALDGDEDADATEFDD